MKTVLLLIAFIFANNHFAEAQQSAKIPRIAVLLSGSRTPVWDDAFRKALRELGYIEGENIAIEHRNAEGKSDRQMQLARELVAMKVDVLVAAAAMM